MCKNYVRSKSSLFLAIVILMNLCTPALAVSEGIQPKYVNIASFETSLSISSTGYASCSCSVLAYDPSLILDVTMELQQYKGGKWEHFAHWNASDTRVVMLDETKFVTSGYSYRVYTTVTVKNSSGTVLEKPSLASATKRY